MEGAISAVERLLWMLFRIFFTLLPAAFTVLFIVVFIFVNHDGLKQLFGFDYEAWIDVSKHLPFLNLSLSAFVLVYFVHVVLEATWRTLDIYLRFGEKALPRILVNNSYYTFFFKKIKEDYQNTFGDDLLREPWNVMRISALPRFERHKGYNNFYWFYYNREMIFRHSYAAILLVSIVFVPIWATLYSSVEPSIKALALYQLSELVFAVFAILTINKWAFRTNQLGWDKKYAKMVFQGLFVAGWVSMCISNWYGNPASPFLSANFFAFALWYAVLAMALREYVRVEQAGLDYLIGLKYGKMLTGIDFTDEPTQSKAPTP